MSYKKQEKLNGLGQAAAEYLLTLSVVFISLAGVAALFSGQVDHYLSLLFDMIQLPF